MSDYDKNFDELSSESTDSDGAQQSAPFSPEEEQPVTPTPTVDEIAAKYSEKYDDVSSSEPAETVDEAAHNGEPVQGNYSAPQQQYGAWQQQPYTQYSQPQQNGYGSQQYYGQNAPYGTPQQQFNQYYQPPTPPTEQKKKRKKGRTVFLVILAIAVVIAGIAIPVSISESYRRRIIENGGEITDEYPDDGEYPDDDGYDENAPTFNINGTPSGDSANNGRVLTPSQINKKVAPSIVAIMMYSNQSLASEGTGIIMNEDATHTYTYILTCAHLLNTKGYTAVIQLGDGTRYDAEIVGYDNRTDIGVLRIKARGMKAAEFGDSDKLEVGDPVYAIGNPGGAEFFGSFTDGIVSAIGRTITSSIGYDMICIQHNAAINPGNSGGALINQYGQVIGVNSSKIAATDFEGMFFAVPITQAQGVINDVVAHGYVPGRAKLGIKYVANNSSSINGIYGLAVQMKGLPSGSLVIASIDADGALKGTDVKPGDMITAVNGKHLDTPDVLLEAIDKASVGDTMELSLFRITATGGRYETSEFKIKVKLVEEKNDGADEPETTTMFDINKFFGF